MSEPGRLHWWNQQLHLSLQPAVHRLVLPNVHCGPDGFLWCLPLYPLPPFVKIVLNSCCQKQANTVRWNKFPALLIHVRKEECAVHLQTTPPIAVAVRLVGKVRVHFALRWHKWFHRLLVQVQIFWFHLLIIHSSLSSFMLFLLLVAKWCCNGASYKRYRTTLQWGCERMQEKPLQKRRSLHKQPRELCVQMSAWLQRTQLSDWYWRLHAQWVFPSSHSIYTCNV